MGYGKIFQMEKKGDIGVVRFNVEDRAMNTWTQAAVDEFYGLLDHLEGAKDLRGAVFISGKPENFHAGADLNLLNEMGGREETAKALDVFHRAFRRLETLGFPTLAAIEGHCLGGGLEFALACKARIAKDSPNTVLGLPECTLGIFPGGGGTQRLPRLIGMPALELILKGQIFPAAKAYKLGIVDRLVPPESDLLAEAVRFLQEIRSESGALRRQEQDFSGIDQAAALARQEVLKTTRGREIPGPMLAIKAVQEGVKVSLDEGLRIEKGYFVEAVLSKEAKGSIHTFFLKTMSDKPKGMMRKGFVPRPLKKVAVLGFGTMGRGVVIDILRNTDLPVLVKDAPQVIEPGKAFVKKILDDMAEKGRLKKPVDSLMARLTAIPDYSQPFQDVDLVIEAVFEDLEVKKEVYRDLSSAVREDCIIASNTSSIPLGAMAKFVSRPERFGGAHFFSPVWLMQLVEIVKGEATDPDTVDNLLNFASMIRKRPIVCRDNPGFVVNAVLFPYFMMSLEFLEGGNSVEKIDGAFSSFGMPIGPIRLQDEVGLDVCHHVVAGRGLRQDTLKNMVKAGHLGLRKSGKGFFRKDGSVDPAVSGLVSARERREMSAEEMQTSVLTEMVRVGHDLLGKGIVDDPRMIDIGMIWGTGFPAEKGGPMKWADLTGLSEELFGKPFYRS